MQFLGGDRRERARAAGQRAPASPDDDEDD
jgi:hypothetical protein